MNSLIKLNDKAFCQLLTAAIKGSQPVVAPPQSENSKNVERVLNELFAQQLPKGDV